MFRDFTLWKKRFCCFSLGPVKSSYSIVRLRFDTIKKFDIWERKSLNILGARTISHKFKSNKFDNLVQLVIHIITDASN